MKKRHLLSVAVLFSSMLGFAQNTLSMNDVTLAPGESAQVSVNLTNATPYTAFQFDMTLPEGITVEGATLNTARATNHILKTGTVNGKYRVLAYSYNAETNEGNTPLTGTEGAIVNLTLKAGASVAEGAKIVIDAGSADQDGGQVFVEADGTTNYEMAEVAAAVTVSDGVPVTITNGVTTLVSDKDLDFSNAAVKAYIATGYDMSTGDIWLTRVKDVPANTPILVMGTKSSTPYLIPFGTSRIYYPENFLKGNATTAAPVDHSGKYLNMGLKKGEFTGMASSVTECAAGKCYLQIPTPIASATGDALAFTMGKNGTKSYTGKYDLDFTDVEGLKAYTVTGYDKDGTVWLTRVMKVSTQTPLLLMGTANKEYSVPSTAQQSCYINMLRGDANNSMSVSKTEGEWTNLVMKSGEYVGASAELAAGSSYLPIPTSFITASTRGEGAKGLNLVEAEVISIKAIIGGDDDATGISRIASEAGNDTWYNLKGQRIDTPTRKGL